METDLLFSIITVTFNAQDTIERTLVSVEKQTCKRVEHIVVDGRSSDRTMELVRQYAERNNQADKHIVHFISEPDNGLYDAMNKGIGMAKGKYIVFLNAGDKLHYRSILDEMAQKIGEKDYSVVYGETDIVDNDGKFLRTRRLKAPERLTSESFQQGMLVCHQSFYALTSLAKETPYDLTYRFSADFDWAIRILKEGERLQLPTLNTGIILTDYLKGGLTTENHRKSLTERLRIMAKFYGKSKTVWLHLRFAVRAIVNP